VNSGSGGGSFTLNSGDSLSFCGVNPPGPPPPPPPPSATLNLDNVIVTSLLSESPCTVAMYTTPPPVVPALGLRWSDTRGAQEFSTDPEAQAIWNRTGYARDRVFELFWSAALKTALNGAFVIVEPWKS
jgi:hypothetical protein